MEIHLSFEEPIYELESRLEEMERTAGESPDVKDSIKRLRKELVDLKRSIYQNLQPWETVEVSRHSNRPQTTSIWPSTNSWNFTGIAFLEMTRQLLPAGQNSMGCPVWSWDTKRVKT